MDTTFPGRPEGSLNKAAAVAHKAVDSVAGAAAPAANWIAEQGDSLHSAQKKLTSNTSNYVSAHPFQSLGIAIAAGLVLGRIFR